MKLLAQRLHPWAPFLVAFLLLSPTLFFPPARDTSLYLLIGRAVAEGGLPYKDAWDIKPPGIFLFYALPAGAHGDLLQAWWRLRLVDVLLNAGTAWLMGRLAARLIGEPAMWAGVLWYIALYLVEGIGVLAQTETVANFFVLLGLWLAIRPGAEEPEQRWHPLVIGVCCGLAALMKPTSALPLFVGFLLVPWVRREQISLLPTAARIVGFCAGIALPVLAAAYWLWHGGAWEAALDLYRGYISHYLRTGQAGFLQKAIFFCGVFPRVLQNEALAFVFLLLGLMERKAWPKRERLFAVLLFGAGFYAMWSQGRAYNYHFQAVFAGLIPILAAGSLGLSRALLTKVPAKAGLLAAAIPALWYISLFWRPTLNAVQFATGQLPAPAYLATFATDPKTSPTFAVQAGNWMRQHSQPGDTLQTWVYAAELHFWSNLPPANRFFYGIGLVTPFAPDTWKREFTADLGAHPPRYVVIVHGEDNTWVGARTADSLDLAADVDGLPAILQRYHLARRFGNLDVLELKKRPAR